MGKLSIFDRLAILTVAIAAVIQALQQALKDADGLKTAFPILDLSDGWNYVPLALLILGGLSWLVGKTRSSPTKQTSVVKTEKHTPPAKPVKPVVAEPTPEEPARIYLPASATPESILKNYSGKTIYEGNKLVAPFVGKWMRIKARFLNLQHHFQDGYVVDIKDDRTSWSTSYIPLHLEFEGKRWLPQLEILSVGDEIYVEGRIGRVSDRFISLKDCALLGEGERNGAIPIGYAAAKPRKTRTTKPRASSKLAEKSPSKPNR